MKKWESYPRIYADAIAINSEKLKKHRSMKLEGYTLALDASCPTTQVAVFKNGSLIKCVEEQKPAMQSLLNSVKEITDSAQISLQEIDNLIYNAGPGSILGIRLTLMSIRTWATLFEIPKSRIYNVYSLQMTAASILNDTQATVSEPFIVCSEWKKDYWNVLHCENNQLSTPIEVWDFEKISAFKGPKYLLQQRKIWTQSAIDFQKAQYSLQILENTDFLETLLHSADNWDIYTPDEKQYATWSGERHRG